MSAIALILAEIRALNYFTKVGRIKVFLTVLIPMRTGTIQFKNIFLSYVLAILPTSICDELGWSKFKASMYQGLHT